MRRSNPGHRKRLITDKWSQSRACAALNIAPYREERSSQVLSALLPATTTPLSDSSSPDRPRSLASSQSLSRSQSHALSASSHEFACTCQPSLSHEEPFLEIFLRYSAPPACKPLPLHLLASRPRYLLAISRTRCSLLIWSIVVSLPFFVQLTVTLCRATDQRFAERVPAIVPGHARPSRR